MIAVLYLLKRLSCINMVDYYYYYIFCGYFNACLGQKKNIIFNTCPFELPLFFDLAKFFEA